jgi:predicted nucleotidyltransferase component of viral defense system
MHHVWEREMAISLDEVRRRILIALFSDDELMSELVLKGGNALALIYKIGSRASVDMDFSIKAAFSDIEKTGQRIFTGLQREFRSIGYVVFDEKFATRPARRRETLPEWWGGYIVEFKLADLALFEAMRDDLEGLRRQAEELGPLHKRKYTIDISQNEFCEGKVERELDDYVIYVYSLEMIIAEKLRAICQQMPDYEFGNKTPRARDFYDIAQIVASRNIDPTSPENLKMLSAVFEAKHVPLAMLDEIHKYKDYHRLDWPSVEASTAGTPPDFDTHFNFVVKLASSIQAARIK